MSCRFLASRWFRWLGATGQLPEATCHHLEELAWSNEQDERLEAVLVKGSEAPEELRGVQDLARRMSDWSHTASSMGKAFLASGSFTLVLEMRCDRAKDAEDFGAAVAEALKTYL